MTTTTIVIGTIGTGTVPRTAATVIIRPICTKRPRPITVHHVRRHCIVGIEATGTIHRHRRLSQRPAAAKNQRPAKVVVAVAHTLMIGIVVHSSWIWIYRIRVEQCFICSSIHFKNKPWTNSYFRVAFNRERVTCVPNAFILRIFSPRCDEKFVHYQKSIYPFRTIYAHRNKDFVYFYVAWFWPLIQLNRIFDWLFSCAICGWKWKYSKVTLPRQSQLINRYNMQRVPLKLSISFRIVWASKAKFGSR